MGKDAITNTKSKIPTSDGICNGSPIILILAIFAVIVVGLYFFRDKLFKKTPIELPKIETKEPEKEPKITNDKFAELNKQ